jgi:hypothetical protein
MLGGVFLAAVAAPVQAQSSISSGGESLLDSYVAYIGEDDLYNSDGQRLTRPWQIIRQDRANFHRFGVRQRGDQGDSFFDSSENRAVLEDMLRRGQISRAAAREIVNGGITVYVDIYGRGDQGTSVHVTTE